MVTEKKGSTKKSSTKKTAATKKAAASTKKATDKASAQNKSSTELVAAKSSAAKSTSTTKSTVKSTVTKKSTAKKSTAKKADNKTSWKKSAASSKKSNATQSTAAVKKEATKKSQPKETTKTTPKDKSSSKMNKPSPTKASAVSDTEHPQAENPLPTKRATKAVKQQASVTVLDPYAEEIRHQNTSETLSQTLVRGKFKPYIMKADEDYMNLAQREHFKFILNDWRAELMQEVDRTVHHMKDESANLPDPADRATQEEEFNLELRTRDRERKLIKKIDKTLERIEHDDYGFCDNCGVDIGLRRLEARPTANLCIDCKTLDEIKERQFRV